MSTAGKRSAEVWSEIGTVGGAQSARCTSDHVYAELVPDNPWSPETDWHCVSKLLKESELAVGNLSMVDDDITALLVVMERTTIVKLS